VTIADFEQMFKVRTEPIDDEHVVIAVLSLVQVSSIHTQRALDIHYLPTIMPKGRLRLP
jgi:hypothetical protein